MEKNLFYQKMYKVFDSDEFKDFKKSYCNQMDIETANMFFVYNFLILSHSQALGQPITPEESILLVHKYIKNPESRKKIIEYWIDSKLTFSEPLTKKLSEDSKKLIDKN